MSSPQRGAAHESVHSSSSSPSLPSSHCSPSSTTLSPHSGPGCIDVAVTSGALLELSDDAGGPSELIGAVELDEDVPSPAPVSVISLAWGGPPPHATRTRTIHEPGLVIRSPYQRPTSRATRPPGTPLLAQDRGDQRSRRRGASGERGALRREQGRDPLRSGSMSRDLRIGRGCPCLGATADDWRVRLRPSSVMAVAVAASPHEERRSREPEVLTDPSPPPCAVRPPLTDRTDPGARSRCSRGRTPAPSG